VSIQGRWTQKKESVSKMKNRISMMAIAVVFTACATEYIPPREMPPANWLGDSGVANIAGTERVFEGPLGVDGVVAERQLHLMRTGTMTGTVQTKTPYGKDLIIPAGTKVFAENWTLMQGTIYGVGGKRQENDPIEWCAPLDHGTDGKSKESMTVCMFWETPERARYMESSLIGGYQFQPLITQTSGMPGPMPVIEDKAVDFGKALKFQMRISKITPTGFLLQDILTDGSHTKVKKSTTVSWGKEKSLLLPSPFGNILLTRGETPVSILVRKE
jgi:hypothetical protein